MEIDALVDKEFEAELDAGWLQNITQKVLIDQHAEANTEMGLLITSQERVRELNRLYRGQDEPTDVLAFDMLPKLTAGGKAGPAVFTTPPDGVLHLGEVVISYPQAIVQAQEQQHSVRRELAILIIHGVLHLLGYDHDEPKLKRQMKERETEILSHLEGVLD